MALQLFSVPIQDGGRALEQVNGFLPSHKILSVDRRWVEQGALSIWSLGGDHDCLTIVWTPVNGGCRAAVQPAVDGG